MSEERKSFIELSLQGNALLDEIDDFIDAWHKAPENEPLHEFLGMKELEYSLWLRDPNSLADIVKARHDQVPLTEVINSTCNDLLIAGRPENSLKIKRLKKWLEEQGELVERSPRN